MERERSCFDPVHRDIRRAACFWALLMWLAVALASPLSGVLAFSQAYPSGPSGSPTNPNSGSGGQSYPGGQNYVDCSDPLTALSPSCDQRLQNENMPGNSGVSGQGSSGSQNGRPTQPLTFSDNSPRQQSIRS